MKKLFLSATAIATVMSASAFAADLPSIKSAPVAPAPLWTGFYAGLNSGYGFGTAGNASNSGWANSNIYFNPTNSYSTPVETMAMATANSGPGKNINQGGFIGGGQVGYNYQLKNSFVVGLEADMQGAGLRGTGSANGFGPLGNNESYNNNISIQAGIDWMGTARGRLGYLVTPNTLIYGTGGLAYGGAFLNTSSGGLIYQSGAYVSGDGTLSTNNTVQKLLVGWAAGAGAEWMINQNWSIKGEALYYDLGSLSVENTQYRGDKFYDGSGNIGTAGNNPVGGYKTQAYNQGLIARTGLNYHFNLNPSNADFFALSTYKQPTEAQLSSERSLWTAFYAGLNAGYGFGTASNADNRGWANSNALGNDTPVITIAMATANSGPGRNINQGGFIGGGQVGYNYQLKNSFVAGLEADMQGAGLRGTGSANGFGPLGNNESFNNNISIQAGIDWMGTARGRLGYLVTPNTLIYGTGGLAYGGAFLNTSSAGIIGQSNDEVFSYAQISTNNSIQKLLVGWTAGAGAEWMVSQNWSIKGEALYYDIGSLSVQNTQYYGDPLYAGNAPDSGYTTQAYYQGIIARAGVNYHFNFTNLAPVVAKF
jgi:outer membrane immunogenic protein